jgi:hypothetical protein
MIEYSTESCTHPHTHSHRVSSNYMKHDVCSRPSTHPPNKTRTQVILQAGERNSDIMHSSRRESEAAHRHSVRHALRHTTHRPVSRLAVRGRALMMQHLVGCKGLLHAELQRIVVKVKHNVGAILVRREPVLGMLPQEAQPVLRALERHIRLHLLDLEVLPHEALPLHRPHLCFADTGEQRTKAVAIDDVTGGTE